jgi:YVTN family beta-propeller protein
MVELVPREGIFAVSVGSGPAIGAELGGYRLEALVGRGGMSAVYRAKDLRLGRPVALKVLAAELAEDERFRARFLAESRLAASIDHPNIVPIFEAGEADGLLYIAMQYVAGTDLRALLRSDGPLAPGRAVALVAQLAEALDAAHARGLVHRDVKPSNALVAVVGAREHVYLADFGLTRHTTSPGGPTASGQMVGTVAYVAPEQIRGGDVDGRADLYSLGCVLFECLTGEVPFPRRSEVATIYAHLEDDPPRPSERRPGLPAGLDAVVARALGKDPERRWRSGAELAAAAHAALEAGRDTARAWPLHGFAPRAALAVVGLLLALAAAFGALLIGRSGGGATLAGIDANAVAVIDPGHASSRAKIPIGVSPSRIAPGAAAVWVTSTDDRTVSRLDPGTHTVRQTIDVGNGPGAIAAGEGGVWVVNSLDGTVSWISPTTNQVVKTISVGNGPSGICAGGGAVWVANGDDSTVTRIDPRQGATTTTIRLDVRPTELTCGGGAVWASSESSPSITEISFSRSRVIASIPVSGGTRAIAFGSGALWVASSLDGTVSKIDPARQAVAATVDVGAGAGPAALAADASGVWVSNEFTGTLAHVDSTGARVDSSIKVGNRPQGLALVNGDLWVGVRPSGTAHHGGTLRILTEFTYDKWAFDPAAAYSLLLWQVLGITSDGLVGFERVGGRAGNTLVPDLAVSLPTPTDGGRTYAFRLRPEIRYSTGTSVRASDVRRQIERVLRNGGGAPGYYTGIIGAQRCVKRPASCDLSRGIVVDDEARTITFHLRAPDSDFLYKLALPFAMAVPQGTPGRLTSRPLPATGPYAIVRYEPGRLLELARNPEFRAWSGAARPDGFANAITIRFGVSQRSAVGAVEKGTADWVSGAVTHESGAELDTLFTRYASQVHVNTQAATEFFFLNTRVAPFDNLDARRALNYAIDRRAFAAIEGGPRAASQPACQMLPPNFPSYRPYCPYTTRAGAGGAWEAPDLAKAERLVARSGTKGMRVTAWVPKPEWVRHGRALVNVLRTLGYKASLRTLPFNKYWGYVQDPRHHAQIGPQFWAADFPGASDFLWLLFSCRMPAQSNMSHFCDPASDRLMHRALATTDRPAADRLWAQAERRIMHQAAAVPIVNPGTIDVLSARVGNYQYQGVGPVLIDQLWVRGGRPSGALTSCPGTSNSRQGRTRRGPS